MWATGGLINRPKYIQPVAISIGDCGIRRYVCVPSMFKQNAENGIGIVEKIEELNIRYSIINKATHLVPCITDMCDFHQRGCSITSAQPLLTKRSLSLIYEW